MIAWVRRAVPPLIVCVTVAALGASQAGGAPTARGAAANSMIGTATNVTPADLLEYPAVQIVGNITAASHRFAYRQCRIDRFILLTQVRISGAPGEETDLTSTRSGHFQVQADADYGGIAEDGRFYDFYVPYSGGYATFILSSPKVSVPRDRLGIRSYTCRPLSLTLQVYIPPHPHWPFT